MRVPFQVRAGHDWVCFIFLIVGRVEIGFVSHFWVGGWWAWGKLGSFRKIAWWELGSFRIFWGCAGAAGEARYGKLGSFRVFLGGWDGGVGENWVVWAVARERGESREEKVGKAS